MNDLGGAKPQEAVHQCNADLDFGSSARGVSRGDAFSEGLETSHFGLDVTSDMKASPLLPERPAIVACGARDAERAYAAVPELIVANWREQKL